MKSQKFLRIEIDGMAHFSIDYINNHNRFRARSDQQNWKPFRAENWRPIPPV